MRITNAPASRKRRTRMIRAAKGFRMRRSKLYRYASDAIDHGRQYAFRDRKRKTTLISRRDLFFVLFLVKLGVEVLCQQIDDAAVHCFNLIVTQGPLIGTIFDAKSDRAPVFRNV